MGLEKKGAKEEGEKKVAADLIVENLFFFQIVGITSAGGMLGELVRHYTADPTPAFLWGRFLVKVFASTFLSTLAGYALYLWIERKGISLMVAGFLSYKDEEYALDFLQGVLIDMLESILRRLKR